MIDRARRLLLDQYHKLLRIHDTPHSLAGGVSIGLVLGFTPLAPLKTLLALLIAWIFRCSTVSAVLAVAFHDVLLPIWPAVLRWEYQIGFYILSHPHHLPPKLTMRHLHWADYLHLNQLWVVWPTTLGSFVISLPISIVGYFVVLELARRKPLWRHHHDQHQPPPPPSSPVL